MCVLLAVLKFVFACRAWASEVLKRQFAKFSAASEPVVRADAPAEADSASVQSEASVSGVGGEDGVKAVAPPSTAPVIPELSEQFTADSLAYVHHVLLFS